MSPNDTDPALRRRLRRHKALATGLLALMGVGAVAFAWLPPAVLPGPWWTGLLRAATRAGVVGGLADWFAVTALFRRPLGLPIPHTGVIPRQKARLGRALGHFVAQHVFTEAELLRFTARLDLPGALGRLLADDGFRADAASRVASALPLLLGGVGATRAARVATAFGGGVLDGRTLGLAVARALRATVEGQRHQALVAFVVEQLREALAAKEDAFRALIADRVREQGGRMIGWALGPSIATRVLHALNAELAGLDPGSPEISTAVDRWIAAQIESFERDPERTERLGQQLRATLGHRAVARWSGDVWARIRDAIERDAARPDGQVARLADATLRRLGARLLRDPGLRSRAEATIAAALARALPSGRNRLADFVGGVVANWNDGTVIDKLELRVGPDLQYIRINGTVVGALAGAALFALLGA